CDLGGIEIFASPLVVKVLATLAEAGLESGRTPSRITISSVEESGDGTLAVILEDDSGGITDEDRATFFERRHGHTHGYGFWLAREILSLTGITVSESGTEGEGCRFELVVPPGYWRRL
ncbi:MAG TPA: ATP-binding protein, partial [Methanoregula sp.]|nr:ATP-binding protein [Methanoregula sp.]